MGNFAGPVESRGGANANAPLAPKFLVARYRNKIPNLN